MGFAQLLQIVFVAARDAVAKAASAERGSWSLMAREFPNPKRRSIGADFQRRIALTAERKFRRRINLPVYLQLSSFSWGSPSRPAAEKIFRILIMMIKFAAIHERTLVFNEKQFVFA